MAGTMSPWPCSVYWSSTAWSSRSFGACTRSWVGGCVRVNSKCKRSWFNRHNCEVLGTVSGSQVVFLNRTSSTYPLRFARVKALPASAVVLTPYEGQRALLSRVLVQHGSAVPVSTIDGFQGQEADLVIVSTVRSNCRGAVGFLDDWR